MAITLSTYNLWTKAKVTRYLINEDNEQRIVQRQRQLEDEVKNLAHTIVLTERT